MPSGDSPDGKGATVSGNKDGLLGTLRSTDPVGGSRTGAGESPAPPIFQTHSEHSIPAVWQSSLSLGILLGLSLLVPRPVGGAETVALLPAKFILNGPAARQQLLFERLDGNHFVGQVTNEVSFSSSRPDIVRIESGFAFPLTNGAATLVARAGDQEAWAEVSVSGMDEPFQWSFRNHVQPVLAKAGCSSGACHGAAAGQNGLKLSLRGYDEEGDFRAITRHALGRRIVPSDPGRSLVLLKPTGALPHKGGVRFETDSMEYKILSEWIAEGTPGPRNNDPRIQRLEMLPESVVLKPGMDQQLVVRAHFSDGHIQDVTRWVKYTDANAAVTQVDETGKVKVLGHGEGAITAWYLSRIAIATVSAPPGLSEGLGRDHVRVGRTEIGRAHV